MYKCLDIYHTNVHYMLRRAWGPIQPRGNRAIHVLHSLFSKDDIGMLQYIRQKTYPTADEVSLQLLDKGQGKPTTVTLSEALTRFEPFSYLIPTRAGTEETPGTYKFLKFPDPGLPQNRRKIGPNSKKYYKRKGRAKETHLNTDCPPARLRHLLKLAYGFLLEGSRVEVHLRAKAVGRAESVDSALRNHLHLRPDTILAAMPPGTTMLAIPGTTQLPEKKLKSESKLFINKTSDVFWVMEYEPALKRLGLQTPPHIKRLGTWTDHHSYVSTALDKIEQSRRAKRARAARVGPTRSYPEQPYLSHPVPRGDDGSSKSDAPERLGFIRYHRSRQRITEEEPE